MKNINSFKKFLFVLFVFVLASCSNEVSVLEYDTSNPIQLRSSSDFNFTDYGIELNNYWNCAIDTYTLPVICSCEDSDIELIPEIWETCGINITMPQESRVVHESLDDLRANYATSCSFDNFEEFVSSQIERATSSNRLTTSEINLIERLINEHENGSINDVNISQYRQDWYNLDFSNSENIISAVFIETVNSIIEFNIANPSLIVGDKNDVHAIWWKVATVFAGSVGSVLYDAAYDLLAHANDGNYQFTTTDQVAYSAKKGALLGATR